MLTTLNTDANTRLQAIITERTAAEQEALARVKLLYAPRVDGAQVDAKKFSAALQQVQKQLAVGVKKLEQVWLLLHLHILLSSFPIYRAVLLACRQLSLN